MHLNLAMSFINKLKITPNFNLLGWWLNMGSQWHSNKCFFSLLEKCFQMCISAEILNELILIYWSVRFKSAFSAAAYWTTYSIDINSIKWTMFIVVSPMEEFLYLNGFSFLRAIQWGYCDFVNYRFIGAIFRCPSMEACSIHGWAASSGRLVWCRLKHFSRF